ncbi:S26 family signal peptidase [Candidatus Pacearchaeota archaeon]|nr:S26 family signal peptidase [Candidatus Pacearchaeota archaeon]
MAAHGILKILYVLLIFSVGFLVGQVWDSFYYGGVTGKAVEAPSDFVGNNNITVYEDRVVIEVKGAKISTYESTGSMLPTLGEGVNGISVAPNSPDEINVGDIISFRKGEQLIVHRVVEKGTDANGLFFVTKGDNSLADDGKIRFEEIERVLIALVY